jgi:hypothetical protein
MIWRGVWSRCSSEKCVDSVRVQVGSPPARSHGFVHRFVCPVGASGRRSDLPANLSKRERQWRVDLAPLRQTLLKLHRIVNQHILPGKRLGGDQP